MTVIRDNRELVELHGALRRVAASKSPGAAAAKARLARLEAGECLRQDEAQSIRAADAIACPAVRVAADDRDPEYAERLAMRAVPIAETLLGVSPVPRPKKPQPGRIQIELGEPVGRRNMPVP